MASAIQFMAISMLLARYILWISSNKNLLPLSFLRLNFSPFLPVVQNRSLLASFCVLTLELCSLSLSPLTSAFMSDISCSPIPVLTLTQLPLCILLQECAWCWVAWSSPTDGTPRWSGTCAGSRRGNTPWAIALYAGPICWPSWASWTPSFSHSWPSSWATGRRTSILMICRQTTKVSKWVIKHKAQKQ